MGTGNYTTPAGPRPAVMGSSARRTVFSHRLHHAAQLQRLPLMETCPSISVVNLYGYSSFIHCYYETTPR
jgi:hypothetical protein